MRPSFRARKLRSECKRDKQQQHHINDATRLLFALEFLEFAFRPMASRLLHLTGQSRFEDPNEIAAALAPTYTISKSWSRSRFFARALASL